MSENRPSPPRVLYVAGYGRSGSTLLDAMLGSHDRIFGAGELASLFEDRAAGRNCSCGKPLPDCAFWNRVFDRIEGAMGGMDLPEAARLTLGMESLNHRGRDRNRYNQLWRALLEAVRAESGADLIVDSSKSARNNCGRLPAFHAAGIAVKGVHLVRDPRAVMWSIQRGSNRRLERGGSAKLPGGMVRGLAGWCLVNAGVDRMRRRYPEIPFLRITYDQLVRRPESTLVQIGDFAGFSAEPMLAALREEAEMDPGHGVAGNRMRRQGAIVLKADEEWKEKMPGWAKSLALVSTPLRRRYEMDKYAALD